MSKPEDTSKRSLYRNNLSVKVYVEYCTGFSDPCPKDWDYAFKQGFDEGYNYAKEELLKQAEKMIELHDCQKGCDLLEKWKEFKK